MSDFFNDDDESTVNDVQDNDDLLKLDLSDVPETVEFPKGEYTLQATAIRPIKKDAKFTVEVTFAVDEGDHKGAHVTSRFEIGSSAPDWKREASRKGLVSLALCAGVGKDASGSYDFSPGKIVGKKVRGYCKWDDFDGAMTAIRFRRVKPDSE